MFQRATIDLYQFYKQTVRTSQAAYLRGKEDAYEEVLKYLFLSNSNRDFRYLPVSDFLSYIQAKYDSHRQQCD